MREAWIQLTALLIIELMLLLPISFVDALTINSVRVRDFNDKNATIEWTTDVESDSRVSYGKTTALGLLETSYEKLRAHVVKLANLEGNTLYYFSAISSDGTDTITEDNNGNFYSFTTKADITKPFIKVILPRYYTSYEIDIDGEVEPGSKVMLYVNDMSGSARTMDNIETADGKFSFSKVRLQANNKIRIYAKDSAGNENQVDSDITVDINAPILTLDKLPKYAFTRNATLKGSVSEQSLVNVYMTRTSADTNPPAKVNGLKLTDIGSNLVELENIDSVIAEALEKNEK